MSAIAAVSAQPSQTLAVQAGSDPPPQAAPATNAGSGNGAAGQPAVIVSLSSNATAASQASKDLGSLDPDKVDDALYTAAGANGLAQLGAHIDRSLEIAKFGLAISERNQKSFADGVADLSAQALSSASALDIPIQDSVSPDAVRNGAAPGTISIGAFSFTSGGSTYSVTPGKNGTLVGTKDGQAWETWQLTTPSNAATDNGAAAALQTLTALADRTATEPDTTPGLDISV